jgi:hypothetical protein
MSSSSRRSRRGSGTSALLWFVPRRSSHEIILDSHKTQLQEREKVGHPTRLPISGLKSFPAPPPILPCYAKSFKTYVSSREEFPAVMPPQSSVLDTVQAQADSPKPPRQHSNTKRTGELAEAAFVVKAASLGFAVCKPWGDSERYDFILDSGHRTWRVQIKCTESLNANAYQVQSTYTDRKQKGHYTPADIDVLVAYILPLDLWYVVPAHAFPASASLRFYPEGNISRRARFEQYREAWHLFQQPQPPADPSTPCHPERSECSAKRSTHGVEGPAVPASEHTADASPDPTAPPAPEPPMERMMTQWAQRVRSLHNRKR